MMVLMWVGMRFAVPDTAAPAVAPEPAPVTGGRRARPLGYLAAGAAVLTLGAGASAFAQTTSVSADGGFAALTLPGELGGWRKVENPSPAWQPIFIDGDATLSASYAGSGGRVDAVVVLYRAQARGREAAAGFNLPADAAVWTTQSAAALSLADGRSIVTGTIRSGTTERRMAYWYDSAGCITASRLDAKLCAARQRLKGSAAPGAFVALSAPGMDETTADAALQDLAGRLMALDLTRVHVSALE
jgi:EpsI family protein